VLLHQPKLVRLLDERGLNATALPKLVIYDSPGIIRTQNDSQIFTGSFFFIQGGASGSVLCRRSGSVV